MNCRIIIPLVFTSFLIIGCSFTDNDEQQIQQSEQKDSAHKTQKKESKSDYVERLRKRYGK